MKKISGKKYLIVGFALLLVGAVLGFVIAQGGVPNPGHSREEIDIILDCEIVSNTNNGDSASVSCNQLGPGWILTGGGAHCTGEPLVDASPSGNTYSVDCQGTNGPTTAKAVCCKLS